MHPRILKQFQSKQQSIEERTAAGKALRKKIPLDQQGKYKPTSNRKDPVSILEKQGKSRIADLLPIRYARMQKSAFAFLRGAAAIMAADLDVNDKTTGINVQSCGDMHVANFGVFASAERNLVFGINDFDETLPAPWEWDLKRLVASIVVSAKFLGADKQLCKESVIAAVSSYRQRMNEYAYMGNIELWYSNIHENSILKGLTASSRKAAEKMMNEARQSTHLQALGDITELVNGKYFLREKPPFIVRETHTLGGRPIKKAIELFLEAYSGSLADDRKALLRHYRVVDVARKVGGIGSVGTRCWIIFLIGNSVNDPLFLQVKEAEPSSLQPYVAKSKYPEHGRRVVEGQRLIQGAPDIFLGWGKQDGIHFYVRQLRDMSGGVELDPGKVNLGASPAYCALCGWALALAHAKSGDAAMIAGYLGNNDAIDKAMAQFAFAYADQTERDYETFAAATKSGKIKAAGI